MNIRASGGALALCLSLGLATSAIAQEDQYPAGDAAAQAAAYEKAMTPGPEHAMLAKRTGAWEMNTKMWMQPGTEAIETSGMVEREMILGDRYLVEKASGSFMGQPFEGLGVTAYDNVTQEFQATWIDNMGTAIFMAIGTWNDEEEALVSYGKYTDPMTGNEVKVRSVTRMPSENEEVFEWYEDRGEGEMHKTMEITYTRSM